MTLIQSINLTGQVPSVLTTDTGVRLELEVKRVRNNTFMASINKANSPRLVLFEGRGKTRELATENLKKEILNGQ